MPDPIRTVLTDQEVQTATPTDELATGAMVGHYRVEGTLGRGGFAWVYQATDSRNGQPAAVKVLDRPPNSGDADEFNERFLREARTIGRLRHPNIVEVYDFGVADNGRPYMAMELLKGHDLEHELDRHGVLQPKRARDLFLGALDALGTAHAQGIVHKDLKPTNLFISERGPNERLVLVDFGIAWATTDSRLTRTGTFTGTPAYAAPEYIRSNQVTPALDVYQIGLVLIEALSGEVCVLGDNPMQVIIAHLEGNIRVSKTLDETDLGPLLRRATALDPRERFANGHEFRDALATATFPSQPAPLPGIDDFAELQTQAYHVLPVAQRETQKAFRRHQTIDVTSLGALATTKVWADATRGVAIRTVDERRRIKLIAGGVLGAIVAVALLGLFVAWGLSEDRPPPPAVGDLEDPGPPAEKGPSGVELTVTPLEENVVVDAGVAPLQTRDVGPPPSAEDSADQGGRAPATPSADAGFDATLDLGNGLVLQPLSTPVTSPPPPDDIRPLRFGTATHAERVARRAMTNRRWTRAIAACKQHGRTSNFCAETLAKAYRKRGDITSACYWLGVTGYTTADCP